MKPHTKSNTTKSTHSISSDQKSGQMHNQKIIDSYDYLANSASTQDCTGLIPSAPQSRRNWNPTKTSITISHQS